MRLALLLVGLVAVGGSACGVRVNPGAETPEALAAAFVSAVTEGRYEDAYALADSHARSELSLDDWSECWSEALREVEDFEFVVARITESERVDGLTFLEGIQQWRRDGEQHRYITRMFVTESGSRWLYWQIETQPEGSAACLPDLTDGHFVPTPEFLAEAGIRS